MRQESNHRRARLGVATIGDYGSVEEYRKRRAERLAERGIKPKQYRKSKDGSKIIKKELQKGLSRMDAPGDGEEEQNDNSGGGHGNTKLPFGLCKRFGIDIGKDWGPREAWDALAGKGITPEGAFERLEKGEDPGTPAEGGDDGAKVEVPEPSKEPVKDFVDEHGERIGELEFSHRAWSKYAPYLIKGKKEDGTVVAVGFPTKNDLFYYLKERGVEEAYDPVTGEVVNPQEMELPRKLFQDPYGDGWFSDASIGMRKGRYALMATDMDGKKHTIKEFTSLKKATEYAGGLGVDEKDIKLSSALKKREAERVAWLTSGKKEYIEIDGVKYGDLIATDKGWGFELKATSEEEKTIDGMFGSKVRLMKFLKEHGVERVKIGKEFVNPQDYEIPKTVAKIRGKDYQSLRYEIDGGIISLWGKDLDGRHDRIGILRDYESFDDFTKRLLTDGGIDVGIVEQSDEVKKAVEERRAADEEKARRKAEWEAKAVAYPKGGFKKYSDFYIDIDSDGDHVLKARGEDGYERGYDEMIDYGSVGKIVSKLEEAGIDPGTVFTGQFKQELDDYRKFREGFDKDSVEILGKTVSGLKIEREGDGYRLVGFNKFGTGSTVAHASDMHELISELSGENIDLEKCAKESGFLKEYEKSKKDLDEFDEKAVSIGGGKYSDIKISTTGHTFVLSGKDYRGRRREIDRGYYEYLSDVLKDEGLDIEEFEMDDDAKRMHEFYKKEEEGVASGELRRIEDRAYKDLCAFKDEFGKWSVMGVDANGELRDIIYGKTYDEAIDFLESHDVTDYKIKHFGDDNGKHDLPRPKNGMRKIRMLRTPDGTFKIIATTGKDTTGEVHSASSEEEARKWLRDNGIDDKTVGTKGMNPNDDVPRHHTARTLSNFDKHRSEREDEYPVLKNMTDDDKKEVVNMMTDIFSGGQYRMWRKGHFGDIVMDGFKNTLETGTSGGATGDATRRFTEEKTFGASGHSDEEGEKYGFVGHDDDVEAFHSGIACGYGHRRGSDGFLYKFKKDSVKDRTTYTCGDTLDSCVEGHMDRPLAGYAGDNPTYEGVSAMYGSYLNRAREYYRDYKAGKITYHDMLEKISDECDDGYIECHYHDRLSIEDVESIITTKKQLKEEFDSMSDTLRRNVLKKLKDNGIMLKVAHKSRGKGYEDGYDYLREEYGLE